MEGVKTLSLSELIHRSLPVTGTLSLQARSSNVSKTVTPITCISSHKKRKSSYTSANEASDGLTHLGSEKNPRILEFLHYPAIITGTVNLWTNGSSYNLCSMKDCFSFTDSESRTICCAILNLNLDIIGKIINVTSWNFIPSKCTGGFLEIIEWKPIEPSLYNNSDCDDDLLSFRLASAYNGDRLIGSSGNGKSRISGQLVSISPVFVVPCEAEDGASKAQEIQYCSKIQQNFEKLLSTASIKAPKRLKLNSSKSLNGLEDVKAVRGAETTSGFLVELLVCNCISCRKEKSLGTHIYDPSNDPSHVFSLKSLFVYFCGAAVVWRPVFLSLNGKLISFVGLKKKMVVVGKGEAYPMYVTTQETVIHLSPSLSGRVTGTYMQGMVVELDSTVWLVLTDQLIPPVHALRVGALISLWNVHFIRPNFSWLNILVLGACVKTNMAVQSFSPYGSSCPLRSQAQSLLGKFIESQAFSARFWVLLIISCFRKKFDGFLSGKDILGTRTHEGLVQRYATSHLSTSALRHKLGIFKEFCENDCCYSTTECGITSMELVPPFSNFISHSEALWMTFSSQKQKGIGNNEIDDSVLPSSNHGRFTRRIISSRDLGIVLMGFLQVSPSSGRLQLIDATGAIDAVIPDLVPNMDRPIIYEVRDYKLVMEGSTIKMDSIEVYKDESFSCKSIFGRVVQKRKLDYLTVYVHFYLKRTTNIIAPTHMSKCLTKIDDVKDRKDRMFHLLLVTHKFPVTQTLQDEPNTSKKSRFCAEAVVLPYDLFLPGGFRESQISESTFAFRNSLLESSEGFIGPPSFHESKCALPSDRKEDIIVCERASSDSVQDCQQDVLHGNCHFPSCDFGSGENISYLDSSLGIACSLLFRRVFYFAPVSGTLFRRSDVKDKVLGDSNVRMVLLEFGSDSLFEYELLDIGQYVIMDYVEAQLVCSGKHIMEYPSCPKILVTSQTPLWSLSICGCCCPYPKSVLSLYKEITLGESFKNSLPFQHCQDHATCGSSSDVILHMPHDVNHQVKEEFRAAEDIFVLSTKSEEFFSKSTDIPAIPFQISLASGRTSECRLPQGELISFFGEVTDVHPLDGKYVDSGIHFGSECLKNVSKFRGFHERGTCIHVFVDPYVVRLHGNFSKHAYPLGLGPGAVAYFHRVLFSNSYGRRELLFVPVSFISIIAVKEVDHCYNGSCLLEINNQRNNIEFQRVPLPSSISQSFQSLDTTIVGLHGKVVAVHTLSLVEHVQNHKRHRSRKQARIPLVKIPRACFIFEDGSAWCSCWATEERAAVMLGLKETSRKAFDVRGLRSARSNKHQLSVGYLLSRMLKKHKRITVRNLGSPCDKYFLEFSFTVGSDKILSIEDQSLLKFIMLNACRGSMLRVVGSTVGSDGLGMMENELMEMQVPLQQEASIWAREVEFVNHLEEARNTFNEITSKQNFRL
ncbi:CST complex subunit CTC1 isoform X2 [Amborella trichopoda]|uniref:CST complex subunit CTC1 isoform X2 n=1 Tax=Amborella trichopoda TaxID=13333 RepID=UPI0009BEE10C|nr:CST complex subunit CTC1 isoform X2 [Amborella trichopoda]|eukprot:XP_020525595.1 CST complex subunit CTC1 isoform X2 [Amborella trichopoda]